MMAMMPQEEEEEQAESSEEAEFTDDGNEAMQRDIALKLSKKSKRAEREANQSFASEASEEEQQVLPTPPAPTNRGSSIDAACVVTRPQGIRTFYSDADMPGLHGEISRQYPRPPPPPAPTVDQATYERALQWQGYFRQQNAAVTPITRYSESPVPRHFEQYIESNQRQVMASVVAEQQERERRQQQQQQQQQGFATVSLADAAGMPGSRSSSSKKKSRSNSGRSTPTGEKRISPGTTGTGKSIDLPAKLNGFTYEHKN
jgi:hypothetical protein